MTSKRPLVVCLTALSLAIALSVQTASAQGLRGRLRDRNNAARSTAPAETPQTQNSDSEFCFVSFM